MFEAIVGLKNLGKFSSFNEAFTTFGEKIKEAIGNGTTVQWLESTNFLVQNDTSGAEVGFMTFYEARDFACKIGLLDGGRLQENVAEPPPEVVMEAFQRCAAERLMSETMGFLSSIKAILN